MGRSNYPLERTVMQGGRANISRAMAWAALFLGFMCLPVVVVPFLAYDPRQSAEIEWFGLLGLISAVGTVFFIFFMYLGLSRRNVLFAVDAALYQLRAEAEEDCRKQLTRPKPSLFLRVIALVAIVLLPYIVQWAIGAFLE